MGRISKERIKKEERKEKKRRQIKESNGSCHWKGFELTIKKEERKVKKRRDKYILHILLHKGSRKETKENSR